VSEVGLEFMRLRRRPGEGPACTDFWEYIPRMSTPESTAKSTSDRLATVLSYGALLLLGYLVYRITEAFLVPLAWSAVLAIFFYPLHERLAGRFSATTASLLSTLAVALFLVVPSLVVLTLTAREALDASAAAQKLFLDPQTQLPAQVMSWLRHVLPAAWQQADLSGPLRQAAEKTASFLAGQLTALVRNVFTFLFSLFLLLFALFFLFRDGESIVRGVRHLLPFEDALQESVMRESRDLIFAGVAVGLLIAAVQGTLGGISFALVGFATPVFWGVLLTFLSLVPVVGSALVWVPAALWLGLTGHWGKALVVVAICGGIAGVVDNFLRPLLLRNRTQLNSLLLFIGVLGGLDAFGMLGLVIGPTIVAAALGVFRGYMQQREPGGA
jgi:predicted PurR-regulated permease PerM